MLLEDKDNINNLNSEDNNSSSDEELLQQGDKTIIKKTGAYAEFEIVESGKSASSKPKQDNSSSIDEQQMGPSMGFKKVENSLDNQFNNKNTSGAANSAAGRLKSKLANYIAMMGKDKPNIKIEYKGEVSINDVQSSKEKETFENRLKQTHKQQDALDKTIENNANKNGVVRRVLAKLEEKIEKNPELAEKFDSHSEVIKHVGHVPASQMSHVDKLVARSLEIQGKSPFDK